MARLVTEQWPQSSAAHHRCSDRSQQSNSALKRAHHCWRYMPMDRANVGTERTTLPCPHALGGVASSDTPTALTHSLHISTHTSTQQWPQIFTDQHATGKGWYIRRHRVNFCLGSTWCDALFCFLGRSVRRGDANSPRNGTGEQELEVTLLGALFSSPLYQNC
jgi:hypothetical protein